MTSDQLNPPKPKRWMPTVAVLCVLILGFFLGILFDAHFRPNNITFEVDNATNRVNVVPREHDVIKWIQQSPDPTTATPVQVGFISGSPCSEQSPSSTCHVNASHGNYEYICTSATCVDPGVDPKSTTNGPSLQSVKVLFKADTGDTGNQGSQNAANANAAAATSATITDNTAVAGIQCLPSAAPNTPAVNWKYPLTANDPLPVKVGQTIVWKSGAIAQFTINIPAGTCAEQASGPINSDRPKCTVLAGTPASVQYSVTTSGNNACSNTTGPASLQVTP